MGTPKNPPTEPESKETPDEESEQQQWLRKAAREEGKAGALEALTEFFGKEPEPDPEEKPPAKTAAGKPDEPRTNVSFLDSILGRTG